MVYECSVVTSLFFHRSFLPRPGSSSSIISLSQATPLSPTSPPSSQTGKSGLFLPVIEYPNGFETILIKRKVIVPHSPAAVDPEITTLEVGVYIYTHIGSVCVHIQYQNRTFHYNFYPSNVHTNCGLIMLPGNSSSRHY